MDLGEMISELRKELDLLDGAVLALEKLVLSRDSRPGRSKKATKEVPDAAQSRRLSKSSGMRGPARKRRT